MSAAAVSVGEASVGAVSGAALRDDGLRRGLFGGRSRHVGGVGRLGRFRFRRHRLGRLGGGRVARGRFGQVGRFGQRHVGDPAPRRVARNRRVVADVWLALGVGAFGGQRLGPGGGGGAALAETEAPEAL